MARTSTFVITCDGCHARIFAPPAKTPSSFVSVRIYSHQEGGRPLETSLDVCENCVGTRTIAGLVISSAKATA